MIPPPGGGRASKERHERPETDKCPRKARDDVHFRTSARRRQEPAIIRHAEPGDAPAVADIYNEYVLHGTATFETEAVPADEMLRRIADISSRFPYLVSERDGRVEGYAYASAWKERAAYRHTWETAVYVASSSVGQGIGSRLMSRLIEECREAGCHVLVACITHGNEPSCALHRKFGFRQAAFFAKVGVKFGLRLDVTDWELILRP